MTRRPLALRTYLAYAHGRKAGSGAGRVPLPERPPGPLIWAHGGDRESGRSLGNLCARLKQQAPDVTVLATGSCTTCAESILADVPPELPAEVTRFAQEMRPEIGLWTGSELRPALMMTLQDAGTRLFALGAEGDGYTTPSPRWAPDPVPGTLGLFDAVYPASEEAERQLRRLGVLPTRLRAAGPFMPAPLPLPVRDEDHEELAAACAGRPIWLAAHLRAAEAGDILSAHKRAVRLAHRLLLVLVPENAKEASGISAAAAASGLRLCRWDAGELPDDNTQVLVVNDGDDLGLWYRLSPVTYLGGSLVAGHGGHDPLEAAALGTAILYGPNVGKHLPAYTRLAKAGAARIVQGDSSLASAISALVAPERAAAMAHAGWEVITQGADQTDAVIAEVLETLDMAPAGEEDD